MPTIRFLSTIAILVWGLSIIVMLEDSCAADVVHGNYKSRIYHNSRCKYFSCKACTVVFQSADAAEAAGYRACKVCGW